MDFLLFAPSIKDFWKMSPVLKFRNIQGGQEPSRNRVAVPARQATWAGGINSWVRLQIRALEITFSQHLLTSHHFTTSKQPMHLTPPPPPHTHNQPTTMQVLQAQRPNPEVPTLIGILPSIAGEGGHDLYCDGSLHGSGRTLIKKKIKPSSYIRKFRRDWVQSHIYD